MVFNSTSSSDVRQYAVISCGSGVLYVGIVAVDAQGIPHIHTYTTIPFSPHHSQIASCVRALDEAIVYLQKKFQKPLSGVYCVVDSFWAESFTKIFVRDEESPFGFKTKDMTALLQGEKENALYTYNIKKGEGGIVIDATITSLRVNGYHTEVMNHAHVRRVECSTHVSVMSASLHAEISRRMSRVSRAAPVFVSGNLAECTVVRDALAHVSDFVLVRASPHDTSLMLVQDSVFVDNVHSTVGTSCAFSHESFSGDQVLMSEFRAWGRGDIELSHHPRLQKVLEHAEQEWGESYMKLITQLTKHHHIIPHSTIVLATPSDFAWIQKVLQDDRFGSLLISHRKPHAILFESDLLHAHIGSSVERPNILFIIHSLFVTQQYIP